FVITQGGPNDHVRVQLQEDSKELIISGPAPSYKPVQAIRSLLHTCWLFFDEEQRTRYRTVFEEAYGASPTLPFVFNEGFLPDHARNIIRFRVWEKAVSDADLPDVVIC